jgi:hypothetical protein
MMQEVPGKPMYDGLEGEEWHGPADSEEWEWPAHPEDDLSYPRKVACNWVYNLIELAGQRTLDEDDVYKSPRSQSSREFSGTFWRAWTAEREKARKEQRTPTLLWALWHGFKGQFLVGTATQVAFAIAQLGQPYVLVDTGCDIAANPTY